MRDDVFICDAVRTPFGRYGGALASVRPDDLGAVPLRALMQRNSNVDWSKVDDLFYGCANQAGEDNRNVGRMSLLLAGMPLNIPAVTLNRLCGSGLDAIAQGARAISANEADLIIAGGVESMTRAPFVMGKANSAYSRSANIEDTTIGWRFINPAMDKTFGTHSMPETAENVAQEFHVSREDQDALALRSQLRYAKALEAGVFNDEIVPVTIPGGRKPDTVFDQDEHPRAGSTIEGLEKLRPIVRPYGSITAGNASGVNDGACALLLASESAAKRYSLTPLVRVVATASAGVEPRIMGVGPVPAVQKVLEKSGLTIDQMDVVELNEAFAAQALACMRELGIADNAEHVNPNGGAIAIGHPLGASGARLATTAAYELVRSGGRYGLCSMCIGVGQGIALVIERV
jgi:acetyl-CoA acyltransferase